VGVLALLACTRRLAQSVGRWPIGGSVRPLASPSCPNVPSMPALRYMLTLMTDGQESLARDGSGRKRLMASLRDTAWKGKKLYGVVDRPAEWFKAVIQMLIGLASVLAIAVLVWFPQFHRHGVAEFALHIVAVGLALAAVVELTYTLFTRGPDEALDPLILGLSSFVLIQLSSPNEKLSTSNAGAIGLLILALGGLFVVREIFIERPKRQRKEKKALREQARHGEPMP
jgi:hypothetical protein